ncbi:MICOS complex subunit mic25a-like [Oncorhynchus tshawytscha]|uniref:MICOS complex subunit mic25a-like n=1 Tax=Oncorhynchus tshawytscha TaxID=74940 RepID=UPI000D09C2F8|nr:MICOS complex subunit mic25a-like [Oncorhynchus tshawytscha]
MTIYVIEIVPEGRPRLPFFVASAITQSQAKHLCASAPVYTAGQKNLDRYKKKKKQFYDQATKSEALVKARNTESVCINLQSQILNCYKENREQTLQCSDLAKTYMQCIDAAKKNLLVNHG